MKKIYEIYGFANMVFECVEYLDETSNYTLLTGKFVGYGKKYTFIKNEKDKESSFTDALEIE